MCGLLVVGLVANLMVRPVAERHWMTEKNVAMVAAAH